MSSAGRFEEKEEVRGAERVGRHAGVCAVPAERRGSGHGREQGEVELQSQCGEVSSSAGWHEVQIHV